MSEIVTAIDIGTTKIVALAGERNSEGKIKILTKGTVPTPKNSVKKGMVVNIGIVSKAIREAVEIAEQKSDIKFKSAFIGIAGQHIKSVQNNHGIFINSPNGIISQEDVDKMTNEIKTMSLEANEEILDVIPQNFSVDKETGIDEPVGRHGKKLSGNFHIIIGETTSAKNIKRCVELAGIKVNELFLEPIASSKAVLTEDEKEMGVALVDIGGGTTDLAIYKEGVLRHTAVIPFGGNIITEDIKEAYQILHKHAEELKTECGTALSNFAKKDSLAVIPGISGRPSKEISLTELSKIIQARMEEILNIIKFEIINSGYVGKLHAGIALTGGGSLLERIPQLMRFITTLQVKLSQPESSVFQEGEKNSPKLSTAVGLIMLGFESSDNEKYPENKKRKKKTRKTGGLRDIFNKLTEDAKQTAFDFFDDADTEID